MTADVPEPPPAAREAPAHSRADGAHLVLAALDHLRAGLSGNGSSSGPPSLARQKESLREWARSLGLLLRHFDLPSKVIRGGQEHDIYHHEASDRYFKVTRDGIFGLSPGMDLALVSSDMEARRFQLWEAAPHRVSGASAAAKRARSWPEPPRRFIDQDEAGLALWNVMQRFLLLTQFLLNLYLCSLAFKGFGVVDACWDRCCPSHADASARTTE